MASYKIETEEAQARYGGELGDIVDLELEDEQHTALVAAGWLTPTKKAPK